MAIEQHGRIGQRLEQPLQKAGFSPDASDMKGKLYRAGKMRRQLQELPGRLGVFGVLGLGEKKRYPADTAAFVQAGVRNEELIVDILRRADVGIVCGAPNGGIIDELIADRYLIRLNFLERLCIGIAGVMLQIEIVQIFAHPAGDQKTAFSIWGLIDNIAGCCSHIVNNRA
ncbi:hypothetical protein [Rhizobium sp. 768_B6_N1_8]|uniref:hypothetical protein n=1 Tax=unclassified Rhizobium TaxID=2613769 RepID=UPI003F1FF266